jgi:hypothetical protein
VGAKSVCPIASKATGDALSLAEEFNNPNRGGLDRSLSELTKHLFGDDLPNGRIVTPVWLAARQSPGVITRASSKASPNTLPRVIFDQANSTRRSSLMRIGLSQVTSKVKALRYLGSIACEQESAGVVSSTYVTRN